MASFVGEIAALAGAVSFSIASVCYTVAGRKVDAVTSIALSLPVAALVLAAINRGAHGAFLPAASLQRWLLLGASGILAFVVSNYFMLNAYQRIGTRLTLLIATFIPVLGALLAWLFLGQSLPPRAALGIGVTVLGILWVVGERGGAGAGGAGAAAPGRARGLAEAGLGTLLQAVAFVLAAQGVADGFPAVSATLMRILAGTAALWLFLALGRRLRATVAPAAGDRSLRLLLAAAALCGPVLAGSLVLLSFRFIPVGVATTLSNTSAIVLIPLGHLVFGERVTLRAVAGTVVAVLGIALLLI